MRTAIISDIHGNYEALKCVLSDINDQNIAKIFCLGDIIGYGPQPEETINLIKERKIISVMGNHELALWDDKAFNWLNNIAKESINITKTLITDNSLNFLHNLPCKLIQDKILFVHGSPPDSITKYIVYHSDTEFESLFNTYNEQIAFVGHTHLLIMYSYNGKTIKLQNLTKEKYKLEKGNRYIISVGSVGQPRDGNNNAKYVIYDSEEVSIEVRFVDYNILRTAELIRKKGLPEFNARRLF